MKKEFIGIVIIFTIAITTSKNVNQIKNESVMSNLVLANVEALAERRADAQMDVLKMEMAVSAICGILIMLNVPVKFTNSPPIVLFKIQ